jgi:hypothetical protein
VKWLAQRGAQRVVEIEQTTEQHVAGQAAEGVEECGVQALQDFADVHRDAGADQPPTRCARDRDTGNHVRRCEKDFAFWRERISSRLRGADGWFAHWTQPHNRAIHGARRGSR